MATTDSTPSASRRSESTAPVIPEQRHQYDGSMTQARVDSIFRALVVRRALERRALELQQNQGGEPS